MSDDTPFTLSAIVADLRRHEQDTERAIFEHKATLEHIRGAIRLLTAIPGAATREDGTPIRQPYKRVGDSVTGWILDFLEQRPNQTASLREMGEALSTTGRYMADRNLTKQYLGPRLTYLLRRGAIERVDTGVYRLLGKDTPDDK